MGETPRPRGCRCGDGRAREVDQDDRALRSLSGDGDGSSNQEQRCSDSYQCEKPDPVQNYLFVHFSSAHPF